MKVQPCYACNYKLDGAREWLLVAGQRPSSLNASGLNVDGPDRPFGDIGQQKRALDDELAGGLRTDAKRGLWDVRFEPRSG
jgi:hypothetical protein